MPKHDFIKVNFKSNLSYQDIEWGDRTSINDELILYMSDSFQWLKTHWNNVEKESIGLNYYGITFFIGEEIEHFRAVLFSWLKIFEHAPEEFRLKKSIYPEDTFQQSILLNELISVIKLCDESLSENKVLVHYGI